MAEQDSVGAIWVKTSKAGKEFLSITFKHPDGRESQFVAFANDKGDNPKRPDYKIYKSLPMGTRPTQPSPTVAPSRGNPAEPGNPTIPNQGRPSTVPFKDDIPGDNIPF